MNPNTGRPTVTILVVDDDEATLDLVAIVLRRQGYRVLAASNAVRGLELLNSEPISLVITDLMMPHLDGITFTQQIHQIARYKDLPVIMMTAFGSETVFDSGMRRGVALTLTKPLDLSKLLDLVGFATQASSSP